MINSIAPFSTKQSSHRSRFFAYFRACVILESHLISKRCYNHSMTTLPKYLTQDELKRFFAATASPRDKALFGVIYHYGLRVGEALMLTVEDVNFTNHRLTIRRLKN